MKTTFHRLVAGLSFAALAAMAATQTFVADFDYLGNYDVGQKVLVDKEGNVFVAGTGLSDSDGKDFVLVKYSLSGGTLTFQWSAVYDGPASGSTSDDEVTGLALSKDGTPYVSGYSKGDGTGIDVALVAFNPTNGQKLWGGDGAARWTTSGAHDDHAYDMTIDVSGNLLLCGDTYNNSNSTIDALTIVFEPDGDIKTGWPETYGGAETNEILYGIATDTSNKVAVTGIQWDYEGSTATTNMLVLEYNGGSSLLMEDFYDHSSKYDRGNDITYTKSGRIAIAGYVTNSSNLQKMTTWLYSNTADPYLVWSKVETPDSIGSVITYSDDFVYASGSIPGSFFTVKYEESDGDYSGTWSDAGYGIGRRATYAGGGNSFVTSIWLAGTNIYVAGAGYGNSVTPTNLEYLTTRLSKDGSTPSPFSDRYPNTPPEVDNFGNSVTVFCVGQVLVAGAHHTSTSVQEFGTLLYAQSKSEWDPTSHSVDVGTGLSGNTASLGASDNSYRVIEADTGVSNPQIVLYVTSNVGNGVSELCFEVESKASATGATQKIELYNYESAEYEEVDSRAMTTYDRTLHLQVHGDPDKYISNSGQVEARILVHDTGVSADPWSVSIDLAVWQSLY